MGPIQLIPHAGAGWAPQKRCERQRATYSKKNGVRYLFGAYDTTDVGVRKGLARIGAEPERAERWRPWRSYALMHLWAALGD